MLRKDLSKAQQVFNNQQALILEGVKRGGVAVNNVRNQKEMEHHAQDPFLNEQIPPFTQNGRVRRAEYKGAGRAEKVDCQKFQLGQLAEKEERKESLKSGSLVFANESESTRRQLIIMEREKQRTMRAVAQAAQQENRKLAQEQAEQQRYLKDVVYRNSCGPEYFAQFGTSAR